VTLQTHNRGQHEQQTLPSSCSPRPGQRASLWPMMAMMASYYGTGLLPYFCSNRCNCIVCASLLARDSDPRLGGLSTHCQPCTEKFILPPVPSVRLYPYPLATPKSSFSTVYPPPKNSITAYFVTSTSGTNFTPPSSRPLNSSTTSNVHPRCHLHCYVPPIVTPIPPTPPPPVPPPAAHHLR
jgi:hypothetical protein